MGLRVCERSDEDSETGAPCTDTQISRMCGELSAMESFISGDIEQ